MIILKLFPAFSYFLVVSAYLQNNINSNLEYNYDLPNESDLRKYVASLQNIIEYALENKNKMDISFAFAIFIGNVNLGRTFRNRRKIPKDIHRMLLEIFAKSEEALHNYRWKSTENEDRFSEHALIYNSFSNMTEWMDRLDEFKPPQHRRLFSEDFLELSSDWKKYARLARVQSVFQWVPNPLQSDHCLASVASSAKLQMKDESRCLIDNTCYDVVKKGSNISYALCHRALMFLIAHYGRGCAIFSSKLDRKMQGDFCSMSYVEAEYIEMNNYGLVDLMLEHISVCTLYGRTEFLRRTWLANILQYQTNDGCFADHIYSKSPTKMKGIYGFEWNKCNDHATALAFVTYSAGVRYIIEE